MLLENGKISWDRKWEKGFDCIPHDFLIAEMRVSSFFIRINFYIFAAEESRRIQGDKILCNLTSYSLISVQLNTNLIGAITINTVCRY